MGLGLGGVGKVMAAVLIEWTSLGAARPLQGQGGAGGSVCLCGTAFVPMCERREAGEVCGGSSLGTCVSPYSASAQLTLQTDPLS